MSKATELGDKANKGITLQGGNTGLFSFFLMKETDEEMRRERRRARVRESKPAIAVLGRISSKLWI